MSSSGAPPVSVIIPVYNEEENIALLAEQLVKELDLLGNDYEIIFVNDGSADDTEGELSKAATTSRRIRVVNLKRNFGQTSAMMAGLDRARGEIIVPMDGDLQNDPADVSLLLAKLADGFDVVSGWRKSRQDEAIRRNLPSRVANWLISHASGVHLNDYGCTLKAYRRDVLTGFRLYGEMHRFVPIFARWQGARITEIPVRHHKRRFGKSKYGLNRVFKVLLDLLLVKFLTQFETKPIYVFGGAAILFIILSIVSGMYAVYLKLFEGTGFISTPLPLMIVFSMTAAIICLLMGLLAEVLVRIYFESQGKPSYVIRSLVNFDGQD